VFKIIVPLSVSDEIALGGLTFVCARLSARQNPFKALLADARVGTEAVETRFFYSPRDHGCGEGREQQGVLMKEGLLRVGRVPRVGGVGDELEAGAARQSSPSVIDVHILRQVQVDAHRRRAGFFRVHKDDLANVCG
jgi:hypothetical protein